MTKRMAAMQPYFFPYLGYWQLIAAVDTFVLFDEAQYIKKGWINRNRILKYGGGWQYIRAPVSHQPINTSIRNVLIVPNEDWRSKILSQLGHYKSIAPYFAETMELAKACLRIDSEHIGAFNTGVIRMICEALCIRSEIIVSSEYGFDYTAVAETSDWSIALARQLGATEFINPAYGIFLQDIEKLRANGISLSALHPPEHIYAQAGAPFEPALSIIDVLMFNGMSETRKLISASTITRCD